LIGSDEGWHSGNASDQYSRLQPRPGTTRYVDTRMGCPNRGGAVRAGNGSTKHLEKPVSLPGEIALDQEGLYELGREQPADIIVPVPTVSTRHAMLRVGAPHVSA